MVAVRGGRFGLDAGGVGCWRSIRTSSSRGTKYEKVWEGTGKNLSIRGMTGGGFCWLGSCPKGDAAGE